MEREACFLEPVICFSSKHRATKVGDFTFQQKYMNIDHFLLSCNDHIVSSQSVLSNSESESIEDFVKHFISWKCWQLSMKLFSGKKWVTVSTRIPAVNITLNIQLLKRRKIPYARRKMDENKSLFLISYLQPCSLNVEESFIHVLLVTSDKRLHGACRMNMNLGNLLHLWTNKLIEAGKETSHPNN